MRSDGKPIVSPHNEKISHTDSERLEKEGYKEAIKDVVKEGEKSQQKLDALVSQSQRVLFRTSTVFPFDLFPDDLIIDLNQIHFIIRHFFFSEQRHSIPIKNILDVFIETSLLFASIEILNMTFVDSRIKVKYFKKSAARRARRIIHGLMTASKEGLDLSKVEDAHLVEKVEELGKIHER